MAKEKPITESPIETEPIDTRFVEAKLRGSIAEMTGEHDVFCDGNRIKFVDGTVTVTQGQYNMLKGYGYIDEGVTETILPEQTEPEIPFTKLTDISEVSTSYQPLIEPDNPDEGEGKEDGEE